MNYSGASPRDPVARRRLAGIAAEDFLEVALVAETAVEGDKTEFPVRPGE